MTAYVIGDSVFMWVDDVLVDVDGDEVCDVQPVVRATGHLWRLTWRDGATEDHRSQAELRLGIETAILARQAGTEQQPGRWRRSGPAE